MKFSKHLKWTAIAVLAILFLSSCAAGNVKFDVDPAGFFMGLWHGFISLFTFIISIFCDDVTIYEVNNTGWSYNLGFILGISIFYGGSSKGSCRRRRK
jgi:hypothetical protein